MKRKLVALILCMACTASVLAGCGAKDKDEGGKASNNARDTKIESTDKDNAVQDTDYSYDDQIEDTYTDYASVDEADYNSEWGKREGTEYVYSTPWLSSPTACEIFEIDCSEFYLEGLDTIHSWDGTLSLDVECDYVENGDMLAKYDYYVSNLGYVIEDKEYNGVHYLEFTEDGEFSRIIIYKEGHDGNANNFYSMYSASKYGLYHDSIDETLELVGGWLNQVDEPNNYNENSAVLTEFLTNYREKNKDVVWYMRGLGSDSLRVDANWEQYRNGMLFEDVTEGNGDIGTSIVNKESDIGVCLLEECIVVAEKYPDEMFGDELVKETDDYAVYQTKTMSTGELHGDYHIVKKAALYENEKAHLFDMNDDSDAYMSIVCCAISNVDSADEALEVYMSLLK